MHHLLYVQNVKQKFVFQIKMLRAVKIRLYPNKIQTEQFNKLLGCYRVVYNQCLARKIKSYKENKVFKYFLIFNSKNQYFFHLIDIYNKNKDKFY